MKLTTIQWKVFQENQKKPLVPVPGEPAPVKPVPVKEPEKPEEKPDDKPEEEITVIQEPSTFLLLSKTSLVQVDYRNAASSVHERDKFQPILCQL